MTLVPIRLSAATFPAVKHYLFWPVPSSLFNMAIREPAKTLQGWLSFDAVLMLFKVCILGA